MSNAKQQQKAQKTLKYESTKFKMGQKVYCSIMDYTFKIRIKPYKENDTWNYNFEYDGEIMSIEENYLVAA